MKMVNSRVLGPVPVHDYKRLIHRHWVKKNRGRYLELKKNWKVKQKVLCFKAYGNKCFCCGEREFEFLAIHHVKGKGKMFKREGGVRIPLKLYIYLHKAGYPKDHYKLACQNCNWAIGRLGYCPHRRLGAE